MARTEVAGVPSITADQRLYRALLGEAFDALPNAIREFHSDLGQRSGMLKIEGGRGALRRLAARLMKLPLPGEAIPLVLRVTSKAGVETWDRTFGDHLIRTRQWIKGGLLMEQAGPLQFAFRVRSEGQAMRFKQRHCWLLGMPLPKWMSPNIAATATGCENGWHIEVIVGLPLLGAITRYEGLIECP